MPLWDQSELAGVQGAMLAAPAPAVGAPEPAAIGVAEVDFGGFGGDRHVNISRPISGRWLQAGYAFIDVALACLNAVVAFSARFFPEVSAAFLSTRLPSVSPPFPWSEYFAFLVLYVVTIVLCCHVQDLYRTRRTRTMLDESVAVAKAVGFATIVVLAFLYLSGSDSISRLVVVSTGVQSVVTLAAWRLWKRKLIISRVERGIGTRNVLIVGGGRVGQSLAQFLIENKHLGYAFCGFLDSNHIGDTRILGKIEELPDVARKHFIDEVLLTIPSERALVRHVALEARKLRLDVKVVPELFDGLGWNAPLQHIGEFPLMQLHSEPIPGLGLAAKRALDILGSLGALVTLAPFMLLIAFLIKTDSAGPALYRSVRIGKKGRQFVCFKFRTMVANADALKEELRARNERNGPFFKMTDDPRVTGIGKFLRKYSLDELPQFWNVLKGEMSLVGPRPHPVDDYKQYTLEHLRRLDVKPGLTGLWQVTARRDPSFESNIKLDIQYIEQWSFWLDTKIMFQTIPAVLHGNGQ